MLRLLKNLSIKISKPPASQRTFTSVLTQTNFNDLDREKKLKILELEISLLQQDGRKAPDLTALKPDHWEHILGLPTKSSRIRYYQFLWQIEQRKISREENREKRKAGNELRWEQERKEEEANNHISYGINRNSIHMRIYDSAIVAQNNVKLIQSMMFEQKLIIDCSYDEFMCPKEANNAGKQLMMCFGENRLHAEPFDLHFCNVNLNSIASRSLHKHIPTMLDPDFPMNIHSESMTEKFDKNRLVYLTPHCHNELLEYNHDDIYIIGAMVDMRNHDPLSLAKAKKQGLRMAKLPLDKYLRWTSGSGKSLTLNQMVSIMLEMKKHGDWNRALRFVPKRKVTDYPQRDPIRGHESRGRENLNGYVEEPQFSYEKSRRFQNRQSYEPRSNFSFRSQNGRSLNGDADEDISRDARGRKQSRKYEFDLSSWGSKADRNSKDS